MSDLRQRALARADEGDLEARAAWLRAQVRAGQLSTSRVSLLAFLGDAGAGLALGQSPGPSPTLDAEAFFVALCEFDPEAAARLALCCAPPLLAALGGCAPQARRLQAALDAAWDWHASEDLARREAARGAARLADEDAEAACEDLVDSEIESPGEEDLALVGWAVCAALRLSTAVRDESFPAPGLFEDSDPGYARDVFGELKAGYVELGATEPEDATFLLRGLAELQAWCLMTR